MKNIIILILIIVGITSCNLNSGPSEYEKRDQEGSNAFDQFMTQEGKEIKSYIKILDQLMKETEEMIDTTELRDSLLPILYHSIHNRRGLKYQEFITKKNTIYYFRVSIFK